MNLLSRIRTSDLCRIPVTLLAAILLIVPPGLVPAQAPAWWQARGVLIPGAIADDYAAINQGQLKNFIRAAYEEFLAKIPSELGGPGLQLRTLISQWVQIDPVTGAVLKDGTGNPLPAIRPPGSLGPDDFAAVNVGQIKSVAAPFYDRLSELYWSYNSGTPSTSTLDPAWIKPWTDALGDDDNYAMANIGQFKRAFALDLDSDADGDGLANLAELLANKNRGPTPEYWTGLANGDSDGDGILDGQDSDPVLVRPATPANFHVAVPTIADPTIVELRWDLPSRIPTGYRIERREDTGAWHGLAVVPGLETTLDDLGLVANRIYQYRATAFTNTSQQTLESDPAYADYEVPFILNAFVRRRQNVRSKEGFEEFYPPSTPPKYYLIQTQTSTLLETSSDPFYQAYGTSSGYFSLTETVTPSEHRRTTVGVYTYGETETVGQDYSRNEIETASVNALDQYRRRSDANAVFTSDADYDYSYYDSGIPDLDIDPESGATYRTSHYHYNDTFDPIHGPPVWLGNYFDLEDVPNVTYLKMGESSENDHSSQSSGFFSDMQSGATLSEGEWAGTRTVSSSDSPPETEILTDPPYISGWYGYGWFDGSPTQTSTQRVYSYDSPYNGSTYNYHTTGLEELSQEYTTEAFMADTIADMPDYPAEGNELVGAVASRDLNESEDHFLITKGKYHFKLGVPSAPKTLVWTEYFVPDGDPATAATGGSPEPEVHRVRSWRIGSSQTQSPEYEIDPSNESRNGHYYIALTPEEEQEIEVIFVDRDDAKAPWDSDAPSLPRGQPLYSGKGTGDMVQFLCPRDNPSSSDKLTWWAEGPELIWGPVEGGDWNIFEGGVAPGSPTDLRWKPGTYTIKCILEREDKLPVLKRRTVDIGFRTDEFVIVGQIVPTYTHSVSSNRQQSIKWDLIDDVRLLKIAIVIAELVSSKVSFAALIAVAPVELFIGAWAGWYVITPRATTVLSTLSPSEKAWLVQTGLNIAPDAEEWRLPNVGDVVMSEKGVNDLAKSKEYRIYTRYQAKGLIGADGTITKPDAAVDQIIPGPTKINAGVDRGHLWDFTYFGIRYRNPAFGIRLKTEPSEVPNAPLNGKRANGASVALYGAVRISERGRKVQWHLMGKDAPWVFAEIQFNSKGAGEFPDCKIYTSMDKTVIPGAGNTATDTGDHPFNNLSVFRQDMEVADRPHTRIKIMPMEGQVQWFIEHGPGWGAQPEPPRTQ